MGATEHGNSADAALAALAGSALSGPIWLHLLVADRCNHSCVHCYQVQGLKGEMSREQIERLLRDFRARGGFVVDFSGGEATLREDLIPLLEYAHSLGLATVLYTNGFSLTEELARALAACHVWRVEVSLYSDRAHEHDAVTRVPESWHKTTQGIRWLREQRINVNLKFTPTAPSSANIERMTALARSLDAHLVVGEHVSAGEAGRLEPTLARRVAPDAALDARPAQNSLDAKPCTAGVGQIRVRSDGQVQPCSMLNLSMGHVADSSASLDVLGESDVAAFFQRVTWNDIHGCRDCDLRDYCGRCFASAAAEVGDMLAPYRGACEGAVARYRASSGKGREPGVTESEHSVGPYCLRSDGELSPRAHVITDEDELLARRHPWLRPSREALEAAACGVGASRHAQGLVQLRARRAKQLDPVGIPTRIE